MSKKKRSQSSQGHNWAIYTRGKIELSQAIRTPQTVIDDLIRHKDELYTRFTLEDGRIIDAPRPPLKKIQKRVAGFLASTFVPHPAAHAYRRKRDVYTALAPHVAAKTVVKLDLHRFFWSITDEMIAHAFNHIGLLKETLLSKSRPKECLNEKHFDDLVQLATLRGRLPIGSPCSPIISNLVMIPFDKQMTKIAVRKDFRYTRYADDIVISGDMVHHQIPRIYKLMKRFKLEPKVKKTKVMHRKGCQKVFGLVLNDMPGKRGTRIGDVKGELGKSLRGAANSTMIAAKKRNPALLAKKTGGVNPPKVEPDGSVSMSLRIAQSTYAELRKRDVLGAASVGFQMSRLPAPRASRKYRRKLRAMYHQLRLQEQNAPKGEGLLDYAEQDKEVIQGMAGWVLQSPRSLVDNALKHEKEIRKATSVQTKEK